MNRWLHLIGSHNIFDKLSGEKRILKIRQHLAELNDSLDIFIFLNIFFSLYKPKVKLIDDSHGLDFKRNLTLRDNFALTKISLKVKFDCTPILSLDLQR